MRNRKLMGIWMDHSNAILMELTQGGFVENTVALEFTHEEKEFSLSRNENLMHNKEQHQQSAYYKKISHIIKDYQEVVLFGPTEAKNELLNLIKDDHLFKDIKIEIKHSGKMTRKHMHDLVREHFK